MDHRLIRPLDTQSWADVYSMEITSNECLAKVRLLLSCQSEMNVARSFQGNEAQTFVNFLDRVSGTLRCTTCLNNLARQT